MIKSHSKTILLFLLPILASAQPSPSPSAHWTGSIRALQEFEMTLDLAQNAKREWIGTISLPFFKMVDVPVEKISVNGKTIQFDAGGSNYEGEISADGKRFFGTVLASIGSAPFQLVRDGEAEVKLPPPSTPLAREFEGTWEGTINIPTGELRLQLILDRDAEGRAKGVISTLESREVLTLSSITQTGKDLRFEVRVVGGVFKGSLNDANTEISGTWTEANQEPRGLTMRRAENSK